MRDKIVNEAVNNIYSDLIYFLMLIIRRSEALALLQNFEDSEYKEALTLMFNYVIERKK
ncbi:Geranylgeranyl pyrophosphate synthase [Flavobacterium anhuiense]|uniref:Geranylgeranyl pyrophosphate synthase n=1 Tax=Flavobacterium anhuiense TaxID=459526 RepID=A0A444W1K5_9FLAO|nr:hypothetical protein [Flavobacterium anhuiense]RYJ39759.1 Geranylgeranyl pyrophosphate synthase [Flavobacterium anhuiense]